MARQAPEWFVARMRQFPDFLDVRYNDVVGRWEFSFMSAANLPVSQFFGLEKNPLTGAPIEPDPVSGLLPFRDLDDTACHEIVKNCERTFLGNRVDGAGTWKKQIAERSEYNRGLRQESARKRGEDFAYLIQQFDLRRPWVKEHGEEAARRRARLGR
jgi:hypothetical protein